MEDITLQEAKHLIDIFSAKDTSKDSKSEKRAKVLNLLLNNYNILKMDCNNADRLHSFEEIGCLLDVSKQYVKNIEESAVSKINKYYNTHEDEACDFQSVFAGNEASREY